MIGQIRSEFLKIRSTRTTIGLVVGVIVLVLLFVLLTGFLSNGKELTSSEDQRNFLGIGSFASVFAALAGILVVTSEYRFGTIRPTFVFTPRRWVVVTAKYAASLLAGIVFALIGQGLTLAIGLGILSGRGIHRSLSSGSVVQLGLGTLAAAALWGGIGVGVGAVVRNHIGAVIGVLVWVFVVENLLFGFVPSVGRFTPGRAQDALTGMSTDHLLPAAAGGAVLFVVVARPPRCRARRHAGARRRLEPGAVTATAPLYSGKGAACGMSVGRSTRRTRRRNNSTASRSPAQRLANAASASCDSASDRRGASVSSRPCPRTGCALELRWLLLGEQVEVGERVDERRVSEFAERYLGCHSRALAQPRTSEPGAGVTPRRSSSPT